MQELQAASQAVLAGDPEPRQVHPRGIAFDCIPQIDVLEDDGWSREEIKMREETRKILEMQQLPVTATCVRVPVLRCHSEAVWVRTQKPVVLADLIAAQQQQPGLQITSAVQEYRTAREMSGRDEVHVGRMRLDREDSRSLAFWVVSDNLLKGAALNAVQILQYMHNKTMSTPEAG
jgi:aspartate-semialdehyde dehydrogenase